MIKLKDKDVSVYKGDYKPVNIYKNAKQIGGYKTVGMSGNEGVFEETYNDYFALYGKSGYKESKNLCPPPADNSGGYEDNSCTYTWSITANADGTFNFSGAMATGVTVSSVTLPAGTYTASGCDYIQPYLEESGFLTLPATFTLTADTAIYMVFWYTKYDNIELTDQYIQIEKGGEATEYTPYAGDQTKDPSPDNYRPIVGAKGKVESEGRNLFDISQYKSTTVNGINFDIEDNGIVHIYGTSTGGSTEPFREIPFENPIPIVPNEYYAISATLIEGYTEQTFHPYLGTTSELNGNFTNWIVVSITPDTEVGNTKVRSELGTWNNADAKYIERFWLYFGNVAEGVSVDCRVQIWVTMGSQATPYTPYFSPHSVTAPELFGIEVSANAPYNYAETLNGETKYYIADSLEGTKLTRRIGKIELTGSESGWFAHEGDMEKEFCIPVGNLKIKGIDSVFVCCLCSHFVGRNRNETWNNVQGVSCDATYMRITQGYEDIFGGDVEAFKTFLKNQYDMGRPVTVYYALYEPIYETVTEYPKTLPRFTRVKSEPEEGAFCYGTEQSVKVQDK